MFISARAKIARAEQLICELEAAMVAFGADEPGRIRVVESPMTNRTYISYEIAKPLPEHTAMRVADAIHNCRVPLDHAFCAIAKASGITDLRRVGFPCRDSKQKVAYCLAGKVLQPIARPIADAIVNDVRPYKGGNDTIWRLHCADIDDKHRVTPPTLFLAGLRGFSAICGSNVIKDNDIFSASGRLIALSADTIVMNYGTPVFTILFGRGHVCANEDVMKTLRGFVVAVTAAVDALERVCLSTPTCAAIP